MTEYGVFTEEGCIEAQFSTLAAAEQAAADYREQGEDEAHAAQICPDHEEQPKDACEECAIDGDEPDSEDGDPEEEYDEDEDDEDNDQPLSELPLGHAWEEIVADDQDEEEAEGEEEKVQDGPSGSAPTRAMKKARKNRNRPTIREARIKRHMRQATRRAKVATRNAAHAAHRGSLHTTASHLRQMGVDETTAAGMASSIRKRLAGGVKGFALKDGQRRRCTRYTRTQVLAGLVVYKPRKDTYKTARAALLALLALAA